MSGDVQPRKRKDRKRKKDELGLEEPRGTAAVLGEGDVFMHSQHEHGTGGHWCAKIIFFSLLAILITLIGLIILENRGLTELEANAVESRYSGVFQGWIEDDNHHDEHTLDLKHHDDDDGEADQNENNLSNELEHDTEDNIEADDQINEENEDDDSDLNEDNDLNEDDDEEENNLNEDDDEEENNLNEDDDEEDNNHNIDGENNNEDDEEEGEKDNDNGNASEEDSELDEFDNVNYKGSLEDDDSKEHVLSYKKSTKNVEENDEDEIETYTNNDYFEYDEDDDNENKRKLNDNEEENDDQSKQVEDFKNDETENDRKESSDEDLEHRDQYENEDSNYKNVIGHTRRDIESDEDFVMDERDSDVEVEKIEKEYSDEELAEPVMVEHVTPIEKGFRELENSNENISEGDEDDKEFLAPEDIEEPPVVESITAPRGKPLIELEDEASSEKPPNTLAEEEEYEKQQEELSRQKEQASHKDGGNSIVDEWPGEPSEAYWRQYLDQAEQDFQQEWRD